MMAGAGERRRQLVRTSPVVDRVKSAPGLSVVGAVAEVVEDGVVALLALRGAAATACQDFAGGWQGEVNAGLERGWGGCGGG